MPVASTVTVNVTAKTAKFENGLKKSKKQAAAFGKAIAGAMRVGAVATAGLVVGLSALTRASLASIDAQRKTARTLGTTQRVLAGLSLAADISGVSLQSFEKALKKQSKAIVDANDGLLTQKKAFDRLNLSAADLIRLPVEEQFKKIVGALEKVENSTLRVGIASDIFGSKNADLINILEIGEDGLQDYINKVDELGIALTEGQTKAVEDANDANLILKKSFEGLGNQLAAQFAPAIKRAAEALTEFVVSISRNIERIAIEVRNLLGLQKDLNVLSLDGLRQEYVITQRDIESLNKELENSQAIAAIGPQAFGRDGAQKVAKAKAFIASYEDQLSSLRAELDRNIEAQKKLLAPAETNIVTEGGNDNLTGDATALKWQRDFDAATKAVATSSERLQMKMAEIRTNLETNPLWSPELAQRQAAQAVDAYLAELNRVDDAQAKLIETQKAQAEAATRAVATPAEELAYRINEIRTNLETNAFWKPETARRQAAEAVGAYLDAIKSMEEETEDMFTNMTEFQRQAFSNMQDILADKLFDPWEDGLDGMLKSFVDMLRKMVANLLATKILEGFFGVFPNFLGLGTRAIQPGAAIGGLRQGGIPVPVGENGPEMFTPGASGAIRPLGAISIVQENHFGGGGNMDAATLLPLLEQNNQRLKAELLDQFERGAFA